MNLSESLNTSVKALNSNKARSGLTILGVVIGVFSVVLLVSLVKGLENYIKDQFENLGTNIIFVTPGRYSINQDPAVAFTNNKLKEKHVEMIKNELGGDIEGASQMLLAGKTIEYKTKSFFSMLTGVNDDYKTIENMVIEEGRFFNKIEQNTNAKVIVLGPQIKNELFNNTNPLGQDVKVDGKSFNVIGILNERGPDFDELAFIPYTTAKESLNIKSISYIAVKADENIDSEILSKKIEVTLLKDLDVDDFTLLSQKDLLETVQDILSIITISLGAIAGISLIVGGIGIMNIMLVSVTERIKEIGLRKALGATSYDIGIQFIFESVLLSLGGGVFGLLLGWLGSLLARSFIRTEVPLWTVLLALGFSISVGIVFGTYPAYQASKKDPIESLRYE